MPTLFQQLENNESMLLMYLAGELPAADMKEVEQMLARDGGLRAELAAIRATQEIVFAGLADLDRAESSLSSAKAQQAASVRSVERMMCQWHADRLKIEPAAPGRRWMQMPGWTYPAAAVASVLIGALIYWGHGVGGEAPPIGKGPNVVANVVDTKKTPDQTKLLAQSLGSDETTPIDDAESQASSIMARSDAVSVNDAIFLSGNGQ
jgi:anti-sigma factor RsiW